MGLSQSKTYRRLSYSDKGHNPALHIQERQRHFDFRDLVLVAFGTVAGTLAFLILALMVYTRFWPRDFVPSLPFNTIKIWNQQDQYVTSEDWMKNWDALMGHDLGFVEVPKPAQYGLSGGYPLNGSIVIDERGRRLSSQPAAGSEGYCLSVMHQLHCLIMLKANFENTHKGMTVDPASMKGIHLNHCFDYLRQAVMCSADVSLEKARIDEHGKLELAVDGWGVEHKCRSWDAVRTFATKHGIRTGRGGWKLEGQTLE